MGCAISRDEEEFEKLDGSSKPNYIALALINANQAASFVGAGDMSSQIRNSHQLDEQTADEFIRKAKNDGQTVSVVNGCLYLDYKFAGFMPPSMC